jgi:nucleotidyltransferase substrate binding protein (TIGR01987 family)
MEEDIRWKQRFENFENAILLLREVPALDLKHLSRLEKEGIVQRFEFTLELGWKTLKDKMEFDGIVFDRISPEMVAKVAYHAKYTEDIDLWIEMINHRNLLSHTYDFDKAEEIIVAIQRRYTPLLNDLYESLKKDV